MARTYDIYGPTWEQHDGRIVTIDGLRCKIRVRTYEAIYPVARRVIDVSAEPTKAAKRTEAYLRIRRELGDDWSTDVLDSDVEVQSAILEQLA